MTLFLHPGALSASAVLQKSFSGKESFHLQKIAILEAKKAGVMFESEEVIQTFTNALKDSHKEVKPAGSKYQFANGAHTLYKGEMVTFGLDRKLLPAECIEKFDAILHGLQR